MDIITLNLARKWRSQDFDHIIGQDLLIRMLKNSLYIGQYFPVYLFSGQRGCGKTTTARVFASALNCKRLAEFRKEPKNISIPCLTCDSCCAMREGKHPDFIEIDAASHTGVDNVRHIIESSSLLPLMGQKKIYLIDETHMLSKSAFNALLKILEEPPSSALFILATTNLDKIIDTVRSRCFQLFFAPVDQRPLLKHLNSICKQEGITCKTAALELIVSQTEGSVRDALNLLEQVRFSSSVVTKDAVLKVLGHIDDKQLINMLEAVLF
ncbi:MAG TPA: DNA polymerase III subunit gamma/tau, partial [Candidatus Dependentiae bacterium]|nr:DNA polymerase III subunit gamma/tau [Candidatus Dependentiae bacterium]